MNEVRSGKQAEKKEEETIRADLSLITKQPTQESAVTISSLTQTRKPKHLTTFKGNCQNAATNKLITGVNKHNNFANNNNSNNNNNNNNCELPLVRNSLESINSRYSISSANDDSQRISSHTATSKFNTEVGPVERAKSVADDVGARHSAACGVSTSIANSLNVSPSPTSPGASHLIDWPSQQQQQRQRQANGQIKTNEPKHQHQFVSMISLEKPELTINKPPLLLPTKHLNGNHQKPSNSSDGRSNFGEDGGGEEEDEVSFNSAISTKRRPKPPEPKPPFKFAGILASLAASVFFSLGFLCIKLVPNETYQGRAQAVFFRGTFFTLCCAAAILIRRDRFLIARDEIWVNFLRAIFGTIGIFGAFCAIKYISLGDSTALVFSSPIWTSLLSRVILKEPLHCFHMLALPLSVIGIVLIAHPSLIVSDEHLSILNQHRSPPIHLPANHNHLSSMSSPNVTHTIKQNLTSDYLVGAALPATIIEPPTDVELLVSDLPLESNDERWLGVVISLCTSLIVSCTYIVLKFRKSTPVQTTTFWLGCSLVIFSSILMSFIGYGELPTSYELLLYFCNGFLSWLGQSCLQWAFFHEKAGILSVVRTMDVAMTFLLSAIFLDEDIYWTSILGASIISLVVAAIMLNNWISEWACLNRNNNNNDNQTDNDSCQKVERSNNKNEIYMKREAIKNGGGIQRIESNCSSVRQIYRQPKA